MNSLPTGTDLAAMFGIELVSKKETTIKCPACSGSGKFYSYTGRLVGPCFKCSGTGEQKVVQAKPGDCDKCNGTGQWRPGRPCFACNGTGKPIATVAIDVGAISTAFASARSNGIKSPKLRLGGFVFSLAPDSGLNAGSIYVKNKETKEYLGKVTGSKFQAAMACDDPTRTEIIAVASDPHNAAKAYGAKWGICSCCGRTLTDGESVALGIGPICRDKFGW